MADICMCDGNGSALCSKCYRCDKVTKTDYYQDYFVTTPIEDGKCDYYWPI